MADVFLGLLDGSTDDGEHIDAYTTTVGGQPRWFAPHAAAAAADPMHSASIFRGLGEPPRVPACSSCGQPLALILQSYDPLTEFPLERVIYVFACCSGGDRCNNMWFAIRGQHHAPPIAESVSPDRLVPAEPEGDGWGSVGDTWGAGDADDWGDAASTAPAQPVSAAPATQAASSNEIVVAVEGVSLSTGPAALPATAAPAAASAAQRAPDATTGGGPRAAGALAQLPGYFLAIVDEPPPLGLSATEKARLAKLEKEYLLEEQRNGAAGGGGGGGDDEGGSWAGESYERSKARHFARFQRRVARAPEQCVRYSWQGSPLLPCAPPGQVRALPPSAMHQQVTLVPRTAGHSTAIVLSRHPCGRCGRARVMELQLMPPLLFLLSLPPDGLDFGTAVVYVCPSSCGGDGYFEEEVVVVQHDDEVVAPRLPPLMAPPSAV